MLRTSIKIYASHKSRKETKVEKTEQNIRYEAVKTRAQRYGIRIDRLCTESANVMFKLHAAKNKEPEEIWRMGVVKKKKTKKKKRRGKK